MDAAAWKRYDMAEVNRALRQQRRAASRSRSTAPPWWQRALEWVDRNQAVIALGVGVVAGLAAVLLTGGVALPPVVGALAAGTTAGLGAVALNAYYGRAWSANLLRNAGLAAAVVGVAIAVGVGVTAPLWAAVVVTAGVGVILDAAVSYFVDTTAFKQRVAAGLEAWPGIFRNAGTIGRTLVQRAGEWVDRQVETVAERAQRLWQGLFGGGD